jgi:hypothetical protein
MRTSTKIIGKDFIESPSVPGLYVPTYIASDRCTESVLRVYTIADDELVATALLQAEMRWPTDIDITEPHFDYPLAPGIAIHVRLRSGGPVISLVIHQAAGWSDMAEMRESQETKIENLRRWRLDAYPVWIDQHLYQIPNNIWGAPLTRRLQMATA